MPTLSMIKAGNKCACSYSGEEDEISFMLTHCALHDELLAQAITESARLISQVKRANANPDIQNQ